MMIIYHCPVCEERPTLYVPLLMPHRPLVAQCPYCGTIVEMPKKPAELQVDEVLKEAEMILKCAK